MANVALRPPPPLDKLPSRGQLSVRPWPDPVIDQLGHDPRSWYVETFWLCELGPSATWLMRMLAAGLEESPSGFTLSLEQTARRLGLGRRRGTSATFARTLQRLVWFDLARFDDERTMSVRRKLAPLPRRQVERLPADLRARHAEWQQTCTGAGVVDASRRRSRRLALSLLELGEDLESTERQLMRWRYHPAVAHEAALWAWARHTSAAAAAHPGGARSAISPEIDEVTEARQGSGRQQ
ncbi:MAG TPA: hypothetical protein VFA11_07450 [Acidimicrobiales bacterium]|nr:hypothetical protein [Acidimicrobiales bacterium]